MSDKTAHLIERAAAFLRSGGAGLPAMPPPIPDSQAEFEALPIAAPPSFQPSTPFTPPLTDDDDTRPAAVVHDPMPDYATPLADEPIDFIGGRPDGGCTCAESFRAAGISQKSAK